MENIPDRKREDSPVCENIKKGMKMAGVILPLSMNQAEALPGQVFTTEKIPNGAVSELYNKEISKQTKYETIGGTVNFSADEWQLFEKYHFRALWAGQEFVGHFAVLPDGRVVTSGDGTVAGKHGGVVSSAENEISLLKKIEDVKIGIVHQHSIQSVYLDYYNEIFQQNNGSDTPTDISREKALTTVAMIREGKMYAAWPPSITDIVSSLHSHEYSTRIVDSGGVWTVAIDTETEKGKELLRLSLAENTANDLVSASQPSEQDSEDYRSVVQEIWKALPQDYQKRQFETGTPTADRSEWKEKINSFIYYSHENGLKMTYTLFTSREVQPLGQ